MRIVHGVTLDDFAMGYVVCALWSSSDNSTPQGGEPLDRNYSIDDIAPETLKAMVADCDGFQQLFRDMLDRACDVSGYDVARAGHDFWLTRNGHGAGFWDRGIGAVGDELTTVCKLYRECDLYIGDDKKIHHV